MIDIIKITHDPSIKLSQKVNTDDNLIYTEDKKSIKISTLSECCAFKYQHGTGLSIAKLSDNDKIVKLDNKIAFSLWENKYQDIIMPYTDITIDKQSGFLTKYDTYMDYFHDEENEIVGVVNMMPKFENKHIKLYSQYIVESIIHKLDLAKTRNYIIVRFPYSLIRSNEKLFMFIRSIYEPLLNRKFKKRIVFECVDVNTPSTYNINIKKDIKSIEIPAGIATKYNYMLYIKTHDKLILTKTHYYAKQIVGSYLTSAYDKGILPCGISLWENYYIQPLHHNHMKLTLLDFTTLNYSVELDTIDDLIGKYYNEMIRGII